MKIIFENIISTADIVVSPRPVWKCRSCQEYGIRPSCPPFSPHWEEAKAWVSSYMNACIIKFGLSDTDEFIPQKRNIQQYLLDRERDLFSSNMYATALFPGNCVLCDVCSCITGKECTQQIRVRPSINAIGIELSRIVTIDFKENVLYGMLFLD